MKRTRQLGGGWAGPLLPASLRPCHLGASRPPLCPSFTCALAPRRLPAMAVAKALSPSEPLSSALPRKYCWHGGHHLRRPWRGL